MNGRRIFTGRNVWFEALEATSCFGKPCLNCDERHTENREIINAYPAPETRIRMIMGFSHLQEFSPLKADLT